MQQAIDRKTGQPLLAIRNDGLLVPYRGDIVKKDATLRPWFGSADPTPEEIENYLRGTGPSMSGAEAALRDSGKIDIARATKEELVEYAANEFGVNLPENVPVEHLRAKVKQLVNTPPRGQAEAKPQAMKIPKLGG